LETGNWDGEGGACLRRLFHFGTASGGTGWRGPRAAGDGFGGGGSTVKAARERRSPKGAALYRGGPGARRESEWRHRIAVAGGEMGGRCWMLAGAVRGANIAVGCGCKPLEMSELILYVGDGTLVRSSFLPAH
jgi:hypothetical protein